MTGERGQERAERETPLDGRGATVPPGEPEAAPNDGRAAGAATGDPAGAPGIAGQGTGGNEGTTDAGEQVSADLDELLADTRRERDEYLELAQRTRADFENYRRRAGRDAEDAERRGRVELAKRLVPAIDNLERALRAVGGAPADAPEGDVAGAEPASREMSAHEALTAGIALVHQELIEGLARGGVETFDPHGEHFDPASQEALSARPPADGEDDGVVVETLERGYRIGETLIRPARVVVTRSGG